MLMVFILELHEEYLYKKYRNKLSSLIKCAKHNINRVPIFSKTSISKFSASKRSEFAAKNP